MSTATEQGKQTEDQFRFIYGERPEEIGERELPEDSKVSSRVADFKQQYLETMRSMDMEFGYWYTRTWDELAGEPFMIRRGKALRKGFESLHPMIRPGELLPIGRSRYIRGASLNFWTNNRVVDTLEEDFKNFEENSEEANLVNVIFNATGGGNVTQSTGHVLSIAHSYGLRREEFPITKWMAQYWAKNSSVETCPVWAVHHPEYDKFNALKRAVMSHADMEFGARHGRNIVGFQIALQYGFLGMVDMALEEADACMREGDIEGFNFELAVAEVTQGIIAWVRNYGKEAARLATFEPNPQYKAELEMFADMFQWIAEKPARTFREAIEVCHIVHQGVMMEILGSGYSPGRMDQILYPYYLKDKAEGILTDEDVLEILEMQRIKYTEIEILTSVATKAALGGSTFNHIALGGLTPDGRSAENELSFLFLQAAIDCQTTQPTLSILYDGCLSERFLLKGIESTKTGSGMPAWINNRVGIEYCLQTFQDEGITMEDARSWALGGCLEAQPGAVINGRISGGSYSSTGVAFLNLPKILELVLFEGRDPRMGHQVMEPLKIETFEDIYEGYKKYLVEIQRLFCEMYNLRARAAHTIDSSVWYSAITADCIKNHRGMDQGGCRYNRTMTAWVCGWVNVVNSLASLKKNVFEEKNFTLDELKDAMLHNFGYVSALETGNFAMSSQVKCEENEEWDRIKSLCLAAPKFGNDDDYVDGIYTDLIEYWRDEVRKIKDFNGNYWTPDLLSVATHGALGQADIADPAGRLAGVTLADGSQSPNPGTDLNGPYAVLASGLKITHSDYMNTQLNMKLHPASVQGLEGSRKMLNLIRSYLDGGAMHVQFNVIDSRVLEDAQERPENYRDLLVRVAGFTQYWVELSKPIQDEIIVRTEYEEV